MIQSIIEKMILSIMSHHVFVLGIFVGIVAAQDATTAEPGTASIWKTHNSTIKEAGVGVVMVVLILIALYFIFRCTRRHRPSLPPTPDPNQMHEVKLNMMDPRFRSSYVFADMPDDDDAGDKCFSIICCLPAEPKTNRNKCASSHSIYEEIALEGLESSDKFKRMSENATNHLRDHTILFSPDGQKFRFVSSQLNSTTRSSSLEGHLSLVDVDVEDQGEERYVTTPVQRPTQNPYMLMTSSMKRSANSDLQNRIASNTLTVESNDALIYGSMRRGAGLNNKANDVTGFGSLRRGDGLNNKVNDVTGFGSLRRGDGLNNKANDVTGFGSLRRADGLNNKVNDVTISGTLRRGTGLTNDVHSSGSLKRGPLPKPCAVVTQRQEGLEVTIKTNDVTTPGTPRQSADSKTVTSDETPSGALERGLVLNPSALALKQQEGLSVPVVHQRISAEGGDLYDMYPLGVTEG